MDIERVSYQLAKELLKPPIRLVAVSAGTLPEEAGIKYTKSFDSVDNAYALFRQEQPKGRWILWLKGSDGQMIGLDSQKLERAR